MKKIFGKLPTGEGLRRISESKNFNGNSFNNPIPTKMGANALKVMQDYYQSRSLRKPPKSFEIKKLTKSDFDETPSNALKIMWLGHASSLIEINGIRILTDPVFCKRVSPISSIGPKRLHATAFSLDELPNIDVVVISHNHYDHLDMEFINFVKDRDIKFVVPLALGETLRYWGLASKNITELDWHESYNYKEVSFTATPARHFTSRGLRDRNKTFWMSTVIKGKSESVFFCGDSGFFPGFKDIGDQYGPFDITMVGIGAYNKQWAAIHTNPEEAIEANKLLKGKCLLPIHWCTFDLAPHPWSEPVERLVKANEKGDGKIAIPKIGEFISSQKALNYHHEYWWREAIINQ